MIPNWKLRSTDLRCSLVQARINWAEIISYHLGITIQIWGWILITFIPMIFDLHWSKWHHNLAQLPVNISQTSLRKESTGNPILQAEWLAHGEVKWFVFSHRRQLQKWDSNSGAAAFHSSMFGGQCSLWILFSALPLAQRLNLANYLPFLSLRIYY